MIHKTSIFTYFQNHALFDVVFLYFFLIDKKILIIVFIVQNFFNSGNCIYLNFFYENHI
jgi:hypothetical protein